MPNQWNGMIEGRLRTHKVSSAGSRSPAAAYLVASRTRRPPHRTTCYGDWGRRLDLSLFPKGPLHRHEATAPDLCSDLTKTRVGVGLCAAPFSALFSFSVQPCGLRWSILGLPEPRARATTLAAVIQFEVFEASSTSVAPSCTQSVTCVDANCHDNLLPHPLRCCW
jgi:hypothetical protein